jgi:hypothetical protein
MWGSWPDIYCCLTITVLLLWGALSDERTGLSFIYAAGLRQRSLSRTQVPWDSWPYFTLSYLRLPFSSPPTTRRVTVEVFEPASTRVGLTDSKLVLLISSRHWLRRKYCLPLLLYPIVAVKLLRSWKHACLRSRYLGTAVVYLLISRSMPAIICYREFRTWANSVECPKQWKADTIVGTWN